MFIVCCSMLIFVDAFSLFVARCFRERACRDARYLMMPRASDARCAQRFHVYARHAPFTHFMPPAEDARYARFILCDVIYEDAHFVYDAIAIMPRMFALDELREMRRSACRASTLIALFHSTPQQHAYRAFTPPEMMQTFDTLMPLPSHLHQPDVGNEAMRASPATRNRSRQMFISPPASSNSDAARLDMID